MMTDFLNEVGTTEVARDSLKMEVNSHVPDEASRNATEWRYSWGHTISC